MTLFSASNIDAGYDSVPVLRNVSLSIQRGEIVGILGHNGMGKTTLLRALMGVIRAESGSMNICGQPLENTPTHYRARLGMAYVPQGGQRFANLTVAESLRLATVSPSRRGNKSLDEIVQTFPKLGQLWHRQTSALSGGERQLVAIARAVVRSPLLLLLDELSEGVQPSVVEELSEQLVALNKLEKISMIVVDQELAFVASIATRAKVMQKGRFIKDIQKTEIMDVDLMDVLTR